VNPNLDAVAAANVLYEDDCLRALPRIPDESVDLVLCDLPYGTTQNQWDSLVDLQQLWAEYAPVVKPRGVIVLTSQGLFTARLLMSNPKWFKYKLSWVKSKPTNFLNAKKQPLRQHEDVCVFYRRQPEYFPQMSAGEPYSKGVRKDQHTGSYGRFHPSLVASDGERYPTDVVYFKTAESEGPVWHPTQKPVALGSYLVRTYTRPGDLVLDNAFGSGSFLVAAAAEGRRFIGIEKNEDVSLFKDGAIDYMEVAKSRLAKIGSHPLLIRQTCPKPCPQNKTRRTSPATPLLFAE
jgi:site-specific DNA-methyltransferase (adenine-specific)/modification methylase